MIRGLYTSALGMTTQMSKMDVVANNIANIDTTGFKKDKVVTRAFTEELMKRLDDPTDMFHAKTVGEVQQGVFIDDVYTDFSNGSLRNTGGALDVAIMGEGFFTVSTLENGKEVEKYSRDGAFTVASDRTLMDKLGNKIMGINGPITVPDEAISINERGDIYAGDEYVDTLRMTTFSDLHSLRKYKDNLYSTTDQSQKLPFENTLEQGFLENSNANSVREMLDMITTTRTYEANQRMITIHDTILAKTVNDVGRK